MLCYGTGWDGMLWYCIVLYCIQMYCIVLYTVLYCIVFIRIVFYGMIMYSVLTNCGVSLIILFYYSVCNEEYDGDSNDNII